MRGDVERLIQHEGGDAERLIQHEGGMLRG